jgi:AcrR family transcriptional regulator
VGSRTYDNALRAEQAAATRRRVVDAAIRLFGTRGYTATRMSDIAREAGVSVDTVHANGPKAALLQAAVEVASLGMEGEHVVLDADVELGRRLAAARDLPEFCALTADGALGLSRRVGGVWAALRAGAEVDAALAGRRVAMIASMRRSIEAAIDLGIARGWTPADVDRERAVADLYLATTPDAYRQLTVDLGRDEDAYRTWVAAAVERALGG